jgi:hypothetical protein
MSNLRTVWVHCYRDGKLLASYDFKYAIPLDARSFERPFDESFRSQARDALTNAGLAGPPYLGVSFKLEFE